MVERIEVDVAQQRAHHSALRCALFRCPFSVAVQHALFEKAFDQRQNSTVQHLLADQGEKAIFRNGVEVALQIGTDDMDVPGLEQPFHPPQRVLAPSSGAKAITVRGKVPLEDQRRLHQTVADRGDSQRTLPLSSRLTSSPCSTRSSNCPSVFFASKAPT